MAKMGINWGIIGCGNVTEVKSGPVFGKVSGSRLVAVMRRDASKARDYAFRHNIPVWYSDAGDLIKDPDVNAVYIATPPASHADYAIKAMEAGKVVMLKSRRRLTMRIVFECRKCQNETVCRFVAYYRRYLPILSK
jgi:predicted dehydrogenase